MNRVTFILIGLTGWAAIALSEGGFGSLEQKRYTSHCMVPDGCYETSYMGIAPLKADPKSKGPCKKFLDGPCEKVPFVCGYAVGVDEEGQMEFRYYSTNATTAAKYKVECEKQYGPMKRLNQMMKSTEPAMVRELGPRRK